MNYKTGFSFTAMDLFTTFNTRQLKVDKYTMEKKYGVNKRQMLCASVLVYCFYLILLDIIENNVTFALPLTGGKEASLYVRPIVKDQLKLARQRGAFSDIDLLSSNFIGYQLTYSWPTKVGYRYKPVYINKRFKDVFIKNINEGKVYF